MASAKAPVLGKTTKADLPAGLFDEAFHQSLVHETARADANARRQGTASTLTRGEVSMTTAKAWRQKGTGRARVGALSVPNRYGGGAAFGPKPRHYTVKVNRKARRKAMRSALSVHAERGSSSSCWIWLTITHSWASGVAPSLRPRGLNRTTSRPTSTLRPLRPTAPANECTALVLRTECEPMKAILRAGCTAENLARSARTRLRVPSEPDTLNHLPEGRYPPTA